MAEEAKKETAEAAVAAAVPAKPKSNLLIVIIIGLVITIATPTITFFVVKATVPPPVMAEEEEKSETAAANYDLKEMYVNIAETKGTRILKLQPVLVLSDVKLAEKFLELDAMLKDKVLMAASTKTIDELEGPNGKESLKREIISLINAAIKDKTSGVVIDVYFTQFLIQ